MESSLPINKSKSVMVEHKSAFTDDADRNSCIIDWEQRGPEQRGPEQRGPEQRGPEQRRPEQRGPEQRGPEQRGPEQRGPEQRGPEQRGPEQRGPEQRLLTEKATDTQDGLKWPFGSER